MKNTTKQQHNAENQSLPDALDAKAKHGNKFFLLLKNHSTLFSLLTAALLVLIVFVWKDIENKRDRASVVQTVTSQLEASQRNMLLLVAKPLVWSVRADMLRGNFEQVDLLITDLVKEKNFQFIHIVAPDGNVILSTNKGLEGKLIGNNVDEALLLVRSPVVVHINHVLYVSAPVLGIDKQLATLIIGYKAEELVLDAESKNE